MQTASAASLPYHFKGRCADILVSMAPLFPVTISSIVNRVLTDSAAATALPANLHLKLVEAQVACAVAAIKLNYHEAPAMLNTACVQLGRESGILAWKKRYSSHLEFVLGQLLLLTKALTAPNGLANGRHALHHVVGVVYECMELANTLATTCSLRVVLCTTVSAVFSHDPKLFDEEARKATLLYFEELVADNCFAGRLAGGRLIPCLFNKFADPTVSLLVFQQLDSLLNTAKVKRIPLMDVSGVVLHIYFELL